MAATLTAIIDAILADPGLAAQTPRSDINQGIAAAQALNTVLLDKIAETHANDDGLITPFEMKRISKAVFADPAAWQAFVIGHGNDNGTVETGFHLVQNDGGSLVFQGRAMIDTVIDAIFHYGFDVVGGRYVNEDGASNETVADVAGWLNFFLNGVNVVHGSGADDMLGTGTYSAAFAAAADETFLAGAGDDRVWAGLGRDSLWGGDGDDVLGGQEGADHAWGEAGRDTLWGDAGADRLYGGADADELGGGQGADRLWGGTHSDVLAGNDGADALHGEGGNDTLYGGEGADLIDGGIGRDLIYLWEQAGAADRLVFAPGDSGRTLDAIDVVEGFEIGRDRIDLTAFGPMTFEDLDFRGGGQASCYWDGRYLRVDGTGDGATDLMVRFMWIGDLTAGDFVLA